MKGYFSLVLHTHMPYVRRNGSFPVGEPWLYQAMSDTYLPLLGMLSQLEDEGLKSCMAISVTPVLAQQLDDRYVKERFIEYLKVMAEHAADDVRDFEYFDDRKRGILAEAYREGYKRKLLAYLAIDGDLLGALASFERSGLVETVASSATHAFLPGLADERSVRDQVALGIRSHRRRFGVQPAGFWLPECGYRRGVEELLEAEGVRYVLVDPTALGGLPPDRAYRVGSSGVAALARSDRAHRNVWDEGLGYPADARYLDSTKYYDGSGLLYWKVTGQGVSIEDKAVYEEAPAQVTALDHARHFIDEVEDELGSSHHRVGRAGEKPLVLASYDTELFGHAWREGVYWLEVTLRSLASCSGVRMTVPSAYLDENPPSASAELEQTTWGAGKDDSTWLNPETRWMWEELGATQARMLDLVGRPRGSRLEARALDQAQRELLLLESSDWPYMVAKDRAKEYSIERFKTHLERFREVAGALERGELKEEEPRLSEIEEVDNLFSPLDLETVFGPGDPR